MALTVVTKDQVIFVPTPMAARLFTQVRGVQPPVDRPVLGMASCHELGLQAAVIGESASGEGFAARVGAGEEMLLFAAADSPGWVMTVLMCGRSRMRYSRWVLPIR